MKQVRMSIFIVVVIAVLCLWPIVQIIYYSGKIGEEGKWEDFTLLENQSGKTSGKKIKVKVCRSEVADFGDTAAVYMDWQECNVGSDPLLPQWKDKYLGIATFMGFPVTFQKWIGPVDGTRGRTLQPGETSQVLKMKFILSAREARSSIFYWGSLQNEKWDYAFSFVIRLKPKYSGRLP